MKNPAIKLAVVIAVASAFGCQSSAGPETSNANSRVSVDNSGSSDHDMSNMNHDMSNMNHDMANMDHGSDIEAEMKKMHEMANMASAPGAASQPFDLQFIDSMIHHHEGAVMMSKMTMMKTGRQELKSFLQKIIDDQQKEIEQMMTWRNDWYAGKASALNMEVPGMKMGSQGMKDEPHMEQMKAMSPKDHDLHFIDMMVPHHQGAVAMARDAQSRAEAKELKDLAAKVISEQEKEIRQMEAWKTEWKR